MAIKLPKTFEFAYRQHAILCHSDGKIAFKTDKLTDFVTKSFPALLTTLGVNMG